MSWKHNLSERPQLLQPPLHLHGLLELLHIWQQGCCRAGEYASVHVHILDVVAGSLQDYLPAMRCRVAPPAGEAPGSVHPPGLRVLTHRHIRAPLAVPAALVYHLQAFQAVHHLAVLPLQTGSNQKFKQESVCRMWRRIGACTSSMFFYLLYTPQT